MFNLKDLKKVNIADFCINNLGYSVDKKHDSRLWRCLKAPSGLKITTKKCPSPDGNYLFFSTNSDLKGSIIDLLLYHGYSFKQISQKFCTDIDLCFSKKTVDFCQDKRKLDNTEFVLNRFNEFEDQHNPICNYLTKRGIDSSILQYFDIKCQKSKAFFPLYFLNSENKFKVATAICYFFDKFGDKKRLFLKDCKKGGSYSLIVSQKSNIDTYDTLNLFESPVDALSAVQLKVVKKHAINMSFCGGFGQVFLSQFGRFLKKVKVKKVNICLDNDVAGKGFSKKLIVFLEKFPVKTVIKLPKKKDFNEDLSFC